MAESNEPRTSAGEPAPLSAPDPLTLQSSISEVVRQHVLCCRQLNLLESELKNFLKDYYRRVGHYFEVLETLQDEIDYYGTEQKPYLMTADDIAPPPAPAQQEISEEIGVDRTLALLYEEGDIVEREIDMQVKMLYRRLVKRCHPDVSATPDNRFESLIRIINTAYEEKDLSWLWRVEREMNNEAILCESEEEKMVRLKDIFEAVTLSFKRLQRRRESLVGSPAYVLQQRVFFARLEGRDLIEYIIQEVQEQIVDKRKVLLSRKRDDLALIYRHTA